MKQLTEHLVEIVKTESKEDEDQWRKIIEDLKSKNIEEALSQNGGIHPSLLNTIIIETWKLISNKDKETKVRLIKNSSDNALSRLIAHLFSSTNNHLSIVTTNYDLICEYAVNLYGGIFTSGFMPGEIGLREQLPTTFSKNKSPIRTVHIWKVHGSIDWFSTGQSILRSSFEQIPEGFFPQIITPGVEKYQRALKEPFRTVLTEADQALSSASSFICIGYGFNDEHIQEKLIGRVVRDLRPICILTKELTPATKNFLSSLKGVDYFAAESYEGSSSKIYSNEKPSGEIVSDIKLWDLGEFLKWSIGK